MVNHSLKPWLNNILAIVMGLVHRTHGITDLDITFTNRVNIGR